MTRWLSSGGMTPLNWLLDRLRLLQAGQVAQLRRDDATQLFVVSPRLCRLPRLPSSGGMAPLNLFDINERFCRLARLPSSGGMAPLNWLRPA